VNWKINGGVDTGFSDLGQTWSELLPRKIAVSCSAVGVGCTEHEVLLFTGGYDPAYDELDQFPSGALGNAIFMVDVATGGEKFFWSAGNNNDLRTTDIHDLDLNADHAMVATPTSVDTDGDGAIDIIYSVDISGGVWRLDFDSTKSASDAKFATGGKIAQLSNADDKRRFYNSLDVSRSNPLSGKDMYYLVTGSGFRAHPNEVRDTPDRLYMLLDPFTSNRDLATEEESSRYLYVQGEKIVQAENLTEYSVEGAANAERQRGKISAIIGDV